LIRILERRDHLKAPRRLCQPLIPGAFLVPAQQRGDLVQHVQGAQGGQFAKPLEHLRGQHDIHGLGTVQIGH
jgi:hypothetical protein